MNLPVRTIFLDSYNSIPWDSLVVLSVSVLCTGVAF